MLVDIGIVLAIMAPLVAVVALQGGPFRPASRWVLPITALLCCLTTVVAALSSALVMDAVMRSQQGDVIARAGATWRVLPILALFEELSRFVVLAAYALRQKAQRTARDAIVLGLAAGLAFALLENLMSFVRIT